MYLQKECDLLSVRNAKFRAPLSSRKQEIIGLRIRLQNEGDEYEAT
jgi:hypothetical protein